MAAIVVSDTTPLRYLVQLGYDRLLPALFSRVLIPASVLSELRQAKTPASVRSWAEHLPEWIEVRQAGDFFHEQLMELGIGEREAIQLATQLGIGLLLMDEREGTFLAKRQGFEVVGTLGVLLELAQLNLVPLEEGLERLGQTNFRRTAELFDRVRALARQRGIQSR